MSGHLSIAPYRYSYATQRPNAPAIPRTDPFRIQVGLGGGIPSWERSPPVNFAAFAGGYPSPDDAIYLTRVEVQ